MKTLLSVGLVLILSGTGWAGDYIDVTKNRALNTMYVTPVNETRSVIFRAMVSPDNPCKAPCMASSEICISNPFTYQTITVHLVPPNGNTLPGPFFAFGPVYDFYVPNCWISGTFQVPSQWGYILIYNPLGHPSSNVTHLDVWEAVYP